jgi:hypothetical protein
MQPCLHLLQQLRACGVLRCLLLLLLLLLLVCGRTAGGTRSTSALASRLCRAAASPGTLGAGVGCRCCCCCGGGCRAALIPTLLILLLVQVLRGRKLACGQATARRHHKQRSA